MSSRSGARATGVCAIFIILVLAIVSAVRHEEIFIICPIALLKLFSKLLQNTPGFSWSLGVLLLGLTLIAAVHLFLAPILASIGLLCAPENRILRWCAAFTYLANTFVLGVALFVIFTVTSYRTEFRNADGQPLSYLYSVAPALLLLLTIVLLKPSSKVHAKTAGTDNE